jgi:hypothetical protein
MTFVVPPSHQCKDPFAPVLTYAAVPGPPAMAVTAGLDGAEAPVPGRTVVTGAALPQALDWVQSSRAERPSAPAIRTSFGVEVAGLVVPPSMKWRPPGRLAGLRKVGGGSASVPIGAGSALRLVFGG